MTTYLPYLFDVVAIIALTCGLYLPRHQRRDLVAAFLGVNIGVMAVASLLATGTVSAGVGLGLFGVLSIIRLRSSELSQIDIAYYFVALALGLIGGLAAGTLWLTGALMALLVIVLAVADRPKFMNATRHETVVLDRAIADPDVLKAHLEDVLGATVRTASVVRLDLVNDSTWVDVTISTADGGRSRTGRHAQPQSTQAEVDAAFLEANVR